MKLFKRILFAMIIMTITLICLHYLGVDRFYQGGLGMLSYWIGIFMYKGWYKNHPLS